VRRISCYGWEDLVLSPDQAHDMLLTALRWLEKDPIMNLVLRRCSFMFAVADRAEAGVPHPTVTGIGRGLFRAKVGSLVMLTASPWVLRLASRSRTEVFLGRISATRRCLQWYGSGGLELRATNRR